MRYEMNDSLPLRLGERRLRREEVEAMAKAMKAKSLEDRVQWVDDDRTTRSDERHFGEDIPFLKPGPLWYGGQRYTSKRSPDGRWHYEPE